MGIGGGLHHNGHGAIMQQQGFHQLNNNSPLMNKCAGCGSEYTSYTRITSNIIVFILVRYIFVHNTYITHMHIHLIYIVVIYYRPVDTGKHAIPM